MTNRYNRRQILSAALLAPARMLAAPPDLEIQIAPVSPHTFRLTIGGKPPDDGTLVQQSWGTPAAARPGQTVKAGGVVIKVSSNPLAFVIETPKGELIQQLKLDADSGVLSFPTGNAPLLALGEGGPQFDRRGNTITGRSGQGGYQLRNFGGRVPINWLIGTNGWAMFVHAPYGSFDFTGPESKFLPQSKETAFPLDVFFVSSKDPVVLMGQYALRTPRVAGALDSRLSAVAPHAGQPRRDSRRGQNLPRKKAALRHHDLPRHRLLPIGMEHQ